MNEDLEQAIRRRDAAWARFSGADPADGLTVDAAIHELCAAELGLRVVLLRLRKAVA